MGGWGKEKKDFFFSVITAYFSSNFEELLEMLNVIKVPRPKRRAFKLFFTYEHTGVVFK